MKYLSPRRLGGESPSAIKASNPCSRGQTSPRPSCCRHVGNVLTAGHEVRQNSTERQTLRQAGGTGRLEDARGKQRAALRDLGRLELVAQALFERRRLASPGASVQI